MKRLSLWVIIGVCALACIPHTGRADWSKAALPDGGRVSSLAAVGTELFAGTYNGLFRSSDDGITWSPTALTSVWVYALAVKDGRLFAATKAGLQMSTDLGDTWTLKGAGGIATCVVSTGDALWATTGPGAPYYGPQHVSRSTDYGEHWERVGYDRNSIGSLAIAGDHVFVTGDEGVYVCQPNESGYSTWDTVYSGTFAYGVTSADTAVYAAVWAGPGVLVSRDLWTFQTPSNNGLTCKDLHTVFVDGGTLLVGTRLGIFRSTDGGRSWTGTDLTTADVNAFLRVGSRLFAATSGGVAVSTDDGATWSDASAGLKGLGIYSLMTEGGDVWLTNSDGVFKSSDAGDSWTHIGLPHTYVWNLTRAGSDLYAATRTGAYRSTDNGMTWTNLSSAFAYTKDVRAIAMTPSGTLIAGTLGGWGYRSSDNGATWTLIGSESVTTPYYHCLLVKGNDVFAGTSYGIYRSSDEGVTWTKVVGDEILNNKGNLHIDRMMVRGDNIYAAGWYGVLVSSNGGNTWSQLNAGLAATDHWIYDLRLNGTDIYAATRRGVYVLSQNATAWLPVSSAGLTDTRLFNIAIVDNSMLAISFASFEYPSADGGYDLWKCPMSQVVCCQGTAGNVNTEGIIDLSDLSSMVSYLTGGGYVLPCGTAANVNGTGIVDLSDLSCLVSYLTGGGYALPACP